MAPSSSALPTRLSARVARVQWRSGPRIFFGPLKPRKPLKRLVSDEKNQEKPSRRDISYAHFRRQTAAKPAVAKFFQILLAFVLAALSLSSPALAQDKGALDAKPLPPLADPADPKLPAKQVFGRALAPIEAKARSIGYYWRGCLAGAEALPVDGESWQVVRLSRNRMWGNPAMIAFLERFSRKAKAEGVWNGILVGDISQPRGGPMLTGHASHQVGLDADVWLTPMPTRTLSRAEREEMSAVDMVTEDGLSVDRTHWSEAQAGVIKAAAEEPEVSMIFVNAAIKKALCETHKGEPWMDKVHAYWGHNYHFHIRIKCPAGDATCQPQEAAARGDGCDKSLNWWFTNEALHPAPSKPSPPITLAQLPRECRTVVLEK